MRHLNLYVKQTIAAVVTGNTVQVLRSNKRSDKAGFASKLDLIPHIISITVSLTLVGE